MRKPLSQFWRVVAGVLGRGDDRRRPPRRSLEGWMKAALTEMRGFIGHQLTHCQALAHPMPHPQYKFEVSSKGYTCEDSCCRSGDSRLAALDPSQGRDPRPRHNTMDGILAVLFKVPEYLFRLIRTWRSRTVTQYDTRHLGHQAPVVELDGSARERGPW